MIVQIQNKSLQQKNCKQNFGGPGPLGPLPGYATGGGGDCIPGGLCVKGFKCPPPENVLNTDFTVSEIERIIFFSTAIK